MTKPAKPTQQRPADPAVIKGIELADRVGRPITDTEVAALAAGVIAPSDLVAQVVDGVVQQPGDKNANSDQQEQQEKEKETKTKTPEVKVKIESDEESSDDDDDDADEDDDDKEVHERAPAGTVGGDGMDVAEGDEEEEEEEEGCSAATKGKGKGKRKARVMNAAAEEGASAGGGGAGSQANAMEVDGQAPAAGAEDSSDECSSESDEAPEKPRRNKAPQLPRTGPLSVCPLGDVSDGEDEEFVGSAVPMTKNEEVEPFLPLGEVSVMDGAEVKEVGTILSLVKPDGTIVVQGRSPPLDEGCVLYSRVVELQEDGETLAATGPKEPLGRIHEIFGPCILPHYTVRVEGAATQHQLVVRYQTALNKLLKEEKERATVKKGEAEKIAEEIEARRLLDPDVAAMAAIEAENEAMRLAAEASVAAVQAVLPRTAAQIREEAQRRKREKKKPNPNNEEKLQALRALVKEAEEGIGLRDEHPFSRWKVGATVYALENAKYLPKESIIEGKGTDASNMHDEEAEEEEFSDDEKEKLAIKKAKETKKRDDLAMQGVMPDEIDAIIAEQDKVRRRKEAKRDAANAAALALRAAAKGGRGGGRGGGGRGAGRGRGRGGRGDGGGRGGGGGDGGTAGRGGGRDNNGDVDGRDGPASGRGGGGRGRGRGGRGGGHSSEGVAAAGSSQSNRVFVAGGGGRPAPQRQQQQYQQAGLGQGGGFGPSPVMMPPPRGFQAAGFGGPPSPGGPLRGPGFPPQQQTQIPNPSQYVQQRQQQFHQQPQQHFQQQRQFRQAPPPQFHQAPPPQFQQAPPSPQQFQQRPYGAVPVPQIVAPQQQQQQQQQGGGRVYVSGGGRGAPTGGRLYPPPSANGTGYPPR